MNFRKLAEVIKRASAVPRIYAKQFLLKNSQAQNSSSVQKPLSMEDKLEARYLTALANLGIESDFQQNLKNLSNAEDKVKSRQKVFAFRRIPRISRSTIEILIWAIVIFAGFWQQQIILKMGFSLDSRNQVSMYLLNPNVVYPGLISGDIVQFVISNESGKSTHVKWSEINTGHLLDSGDVELGPNKKVVITASTLGSKIGSMIEIHVGKLPKPLTVSIVG